MVKTRQSLNPASSKTPQKKIKKTAKRLAGKIKAENLDRCKEWIQQQKKEKPKLQPVIDDLNSGESDVDDDELSENIRLNSATTQKATDQKTLTKICFACEWQRCNAIIETYVELQHHVSKHLNTHRSTANLSAEKSFKCCWDLCDYETDVFIILERHVCFHVYMSNLKTLGEQLLHKKEPLPACVNDSSRRNLIPDTASKYVCMWRDCKYTFDTPQEYFDHARQHCLHEIDMHKQGNRNNVVQCKWLNCKKMFKKRLKMTDHMRTHTGERFVACSHCGSTFNSYGKFYDHFKRQAINNNYKCSQCFRYFHTEELLNNHMYAHINCIKCTMCDMTCPSPAALTQHFRYRHIKERPYKCTQCDYGAVTKWDLNKHIDRKHNTEQTTYYCEEFECDYTCLNMNLMRKHVRNIHGEGSNLYCCHVCNRRYQSGAATSRHLIKNHGFQLPSGHRRFTYRLDIDGMYRVQTTRMESLEVSEQIMAPPVNDMAKSNNIIYSLTNFQKTNTGLSIAVVESTVEDENSVNDMLKKECKAMDDLMNDSNDEDVRSVESVDTSDSETTETRLASVNIAKDLTESNTFKGRIKSKHIVTNESHADTPNIDDTVQIEFIGDNYGGNELKSIDNFSVMKKYLKKKRQKNRIILTVEDLDAEGNVLHTETRKVSEYELKRYERTLTH